MTSHWATTPELEDLYIDAKIKGADNFILETEVRSRKFLEKIAINGGENNLRTFALILKNIIIFLI